MLDFPLSPEKAADVAGHIDAVYYTLTGLSVFFTLGVFLTALVLVVRYRAGSPASREGATDHSMKVELIWTIIPLMMALAVFVWNVEVYARVYGEAPKDALNISVIGKQWMWHIQHANGIRENNELHVPVGRPVKLTMISQDVVHSFFVPAFRVKRDVLPGRYNSFWFTPSKVGRYRLFCSEYCGAFHSLMTGWVTVMRADEYEKWLSSGGGKDSGVMLGGSDLPPAAAGKLAFSQLGCEQCHVTGVSLGRAPTLQGLYGGYVRLSDGQLVKADDAYIRESIQNPTSKVVENFTPIMPNYGTLLSDKILDNLVAYIKSIGRKEPVKEAKR